MSDAIAGVTVGLTVIPQGELGNLQLMLTDYRGRDRLRRSGGPSSPVRSLLRLHGLLRLLRVR